MKNIQKFIQQKPSIVTHKSEGGSKDRQRELSRENKVSKYQTGGSNTRIRKSEGSLFLDSKLEDWRGEKYFEGKKQLVNWYQT